MSACGLRQPSGARRRRKGTAVDASAPRVSRDNPTRHSAEITRSGMESLLATPPSSAPTRNQTVSAAAHFRGSAVIRPSGLLSSPAQTHSLACRFREAGRETVDDACAQAMRTGIPDIWI